MEIRRFNMHGDTDVNGYYVNYADVAKLVELNKELVEALNIAVDTTKEICYFRDVPPPASMYESATKALNKAKELNK